MTGPRIIEFPSGTRLAAGVTWRSVPQGLRALLPGSPVGPSLLPGDPGCVLRIGERFAQLDASLSGEGAGSLLVALARGLADRSKPPGPGLWLLVAELPASDGEPGHWLGEIALVEGAEGDPVAVQPVPAPEELHADREGFLSAIADIASITALAGVAVGSSGGKARTSLVKDVKACLSKGHGAGTDRPAPPVVTVDAAQDPGPVFVRQKAVPRRAYVIGGVAAAAALAAAVVLPAVVKGLLSEPAPPAPAMVAAVPEQGAFAVACTSALAEWWPRIVGWTAAERGCALADSLPPFGAPPPGDIAGDLAGNAPALPFVAWVRLEPTPAANPVLAKHAARIVLSGWPHGRRESGEAMLLWQSATLTLQPLPEGDRPAVTDPERIVAALSALWAHRPGAVASGEDGIVVTAGGDASALLSRAARVEAVVPVRLVMAAKGPGRLTLKPRAPRLVPEDLFDALPPEGGPLAAHAAPPDPNGERQ
ncbi:MAG: hypothetical protein F4Y57_01065 [Acidobacteria bacterium]|nr:hypothetical protein [Acidobacteriota bacterium]